MPGMDFQYSFALVILLFLTCASVVRTGRVVSSADIETLQVAQVIFRHGSRSPLTSYYKDPYNNTVYWPDGLGQLTAKGKAQEYELGQYLQWRYMKFIGKAYSAKDVYAQSSDVDRTIMSGELVLAGMYPPSDDSPNSMWNPTIKWQPIPIHTLSTTEDNKIGYSVPCPRYEKMFYDYLKSPEMEAINTGNDYMYKYLSEHSKNNISNIVTATDLYDVLFIQELHSLKIPDWALRYYPDKLKKTAELLWDVVVKKDGMKRLRGGPLLGDLLLNVERHVNPRNQIKYPNPPSKLYLYSGHDSTIASFLGTLDVFDRQIPPYSSAIMLELHKQKEGSENAGEYFIEVFFRNDTTKPPYKLTIPNCGQSCPLEMFKKLYKNIIISDRGLWYQECHSSSSFITTAATEAFFSDIDTLGIVVLIFIFLSGLLFATVFFVLIMLPIHRRKLKRDKESFGSTPSLGSKSLPRNSITNNNFRHFKV